MALLGRDAIRAAIRAIEAELAGGPPAELPGEVQALAALLLQREERALAVEREQPERELLAAVPDAAALVGKDGRVRVANSAFEGLSPLEVTRQAVLGEAMRRALEGTPRRLELSLGRRTFAAQLTPLVRGDVLLVLRDVTEAKRAETARRDFVA